MYYIFIETCSVRKKGYTPFLKNYLSNITDFDYNRVVRIEDTHLSIYLISLTLITIE